MKIGIIGLAGRMGLALIEEVKQTGHEVSGGLLRAGEVAPIGQKVFPDLAALASASDVVIDFTNAHTVPQHAEVLEKSGKPWVLGTSGLSSSDDEIVAKASKSIPVVYSQNFSIGIALLMDFAKRMGAALPAEHYDAEIIEMHHQKKVDAPSGTALLLGREVAEGRGVKLAEVIQSGRSGDTGARRVGTIGFSSVRAGQVVGEHTLLFASTTEHVSLVHRVFDRRVFAHGAVRAAVWSKDRKAGLYDLRDVTKSG